MLRKVIISAGSGAIFLSLLACISMKNHDVKAFNIKKAYYQSWVVSELEKGTDIILELSDVDPEAVFDSIVFRGVRLKTFAAIHNNEVELKSILPVGISRLKIDFEVVGLPDQLIYHFRGERKSYLLKSIERKNTRFYRL
jgi:hypothetical protein